MKCNDRQNNGKIQNLMKSTKTSSPTGHSGARSLPLIGDSFMHVETSQTNEIVKIFSSLLSEQILFKLVLLVFFKTDFQL